MGFVALLLDLVFDGVEPHRWWRPGRLAVVLVIAGSSAVHTWQQAQVRQTNVDLLAASLGERAAKDDLIVVTPWYMGITFERYYRGAAPWKTVPPLESHSFHRYDLIKAL